jgi:cellulose synthase (UDP-forming)
MYGPENEILTVWVSIVWVFYNLIILGGAVAVSVESKQVRRSHRVEMSMPAAIAREDGHLFSCTVHDYSDGGLGIKIHGEAQVLEGQRQAAAQTRTAGVCLPGAGSRGSTAAKSGCSCCR